MFDRHVPLCAEAAVHCAAYRRRPRGPSITWYDRSESCHLLEGLVPAFPYTGLCVVDARRSFYTCPPITQDNDARLDVRGQSLVSAGAVPGDALPI
jgi:hypothetical protein